MAQKYTTISKDGISYLCSCIKQLASVSEAINNTNLADDKVFSNLYTKKLIDKCLEDANTEAQKLVGALTYLTCEETTVQPTLDNSSINVIYLYSATGNAPYQQYLKINETELIDMGSTTSFNDLVTSVEKKIDKDKIITVLDDTVTDEQVPSAKAVYDVWGEWSVISPIKEGHARNSNGGGVSYYKQIKDMVTVTCLNGSGRLIYTWNIGAKINGGGALPKPIIKIPVSIMSSNGEFYLAELDTDGYIKVKNRNIPQTETGNIYYYSFNYITNEL